MADTAVATPAEKKAPPKFKQRTTRTFKSKAPKPGQKGWECQLSHFSALKSIQWINQTQNLLYFSFSSFGDDIPGMEGLGTDITVVCPWEAFGDMELSDLAKYGIV